MKQERTAKDYMGKCRVVKFLVRQDNNELLKVMDDYELRSLTEGDSVLFFPKFYEAPYDIYELEDKGSLTSAEVRKFQRLIRLKNINKKNMIVVNKERVAKPANELELGYLAGYIKKANGEVDIKETRKFIKKLIDLGLLCRSHNDKLNVVEFYVSPLYRKPSARLHVDLYAMFHDQCYKAMTCTEITKDDYINKEIEEKLIKTNTYRNALEWLYKKKRETTVGTQEQAEYLVLERAKSAEEIYYEKLRADKEIDDIADAGDILSVATKNMDENKAAAKKVEVTVACEPYIALAIKKSDITPQIADVIEKACADEFGDPAAIVAASNGYLKLDDNATETDNILTH